MTSDEFNAQFPAKPANTINPTFLAWLSQVDAIIQKSTGLSYEDLPDFLYADEYEDGASPAQAARAAIRAAKEY